MGILLTTSGAIVLGPGGGTLSTGAPTAPTDITISASSIMETSAGAVAAGTVIGVLGAVGGTAPYSFAITGGTHAAQFQVVSGELRAASGNTLAASGSPFSVQVTVTDANSLTYPETLSVAITAYEAAILIAEFTANNYGGSASPSIHALGHIFKQGDVPSGYTLELRRKSDQTVIPLGIDGPASWPDGSLAYAGLRFHDATGDVPASSGRVFELYRVFGSRIAAPTGFDGVAWITANSDRRIELTGMLDNYDAAMSPSQRDISLNSHLGVSTRVRTTLDHSRVQEIACWGMAASDGHLKGEHYLTLFRDAGGAVLGAFHDAVVAQDWYVSDPGFGATAEVKQRRQYFAAYRNGADPPIAEYWGDLSDTTRIQQPYHSAWAAVVRSGASRGDPQWIAGTESRRPTFWYGIDKDYWRLAGMTLPYKNLGTIYRTISDDDYRPLDNYEFNQDISTAGGSVGRGPMLVFDALELQKQDASTWRNWLIRSFAGLHCAKYRCRNHKVVSAIGDVGNENFAWQIQSGAASATAGLTTGEMGRLGTRELLSNDNSNSPTVTWTHPLGLNDNSTSRYYGSFANWIPEGGNAHSPSWGFWAALRTGRRMFRQVAIDNFFSAIWRAAYTMKTSTNRWPGTPVPAAQYFTPTASNDQTRGMAWYQNLLANGLAVAPDGTDLRTHMKEIVQVNADLYSWMLDTVEAQNGIPFARRLLYHYDSSGFQEWQHAFAAMAAWRLHKVSGLGIYDRVADYVSSWFLKIYAGDYPLKSQSLTIVARCLTLPWNATTNPYQSDNGITERVSIYSGDNTRLIAPQSGTGSTRYTNEYKPTVGDVVQFSDGGGSVDQMIQSPLAINTDYYITDIVDTGTAWHVNVSDTPGGAALDFTGGNMSASWVISCFEPAALYQVTDPTLVDMNPPGGAGGEAHRIMTVLNLLLRKQTSAYFTSGERTDALANKLAMESILIPWMDYDRLNYYAFDPVWWVEEVQA